MTQVSAGVTGSLMIQGTTSDAGKSICVAGLCRVLKRRGIRVAPFKPQNMALNSAVTQCGGEIGRAQALQAIACGLELSTDFNPVLLKPMSDQGSQVIIQGQVVEQLDAAKFGDIKSLAFDKVLESYWRLKQNYDVVLIEGAGSPAEVNLRENDIANMGFAEAVDCPVVLISDINRGGVFAHLTGTLNLLSLSEQERTRGFIINQFRGHLGLLQSGLDWLEDNTQRPVLGVIPYINALKLDAEDALQQAPIIEEAFLSIKIPVLPRISNHTDFEPLKWHPKVNLTFVGEGESLDGADLIILPGTKQVRDDLKFLIAQHWDTAIKKHLRYGGKVLGICGGFQMLGELIEDPEDIESEAGTSRGLGLLEVNTKLRPKKQLAQVSGTSLIGSKNNKLTGYEIHCGETVGADCIRPFARLIDSHNCHRDDGAISDDGQIIGTYVHGLFEDKQSFNAILDWAMDSQSSHNEIKNEQSWDQIREQELERLADSFEAHLDIDHIISIIKQDSYSQKESSNG